MGRFSFLLLSFLLSLKSFALDCPIPEEALNFQCEGTFVAKDMKGLKKYLSTNYAMANSKAKNLRVAFNLTSDGTVNIETPCTLFINAKKVISPNALCLNARDGVEFARESSIISNQVELRSNSYIKFALNSKANVTTLKANASRIILANNVKVDSSSISLNATDKLLLRQATVKASPIEANASDCIINPNFTVVGSKQGNCFNSSHPILKIKYSSSEGEAPFTFKVDA